MITTKLTEEALDTLRQLKLDLKLRTTSDVIMYLARTYADIRSPLVIDKIEDISEEDMKKLIEVLERPSKLIPVPRGVDNA